MKLSRKLLGITLSAALLLSGISVFSTPAASSVENVITDSADLYQEGSCAPVPSSDASRTGASIKSVSTQTFTGVEQVIYDGLNNCESSIDISRYQLSQDELKTHVNNVINCSPELFYVDSRYSLVPGSNGITTYKPSYKMSGSTLTQARTYFQTQMNQILSRVNPDWSDLEKIVFIHDYLAQHFEYDTTYSIYDGYNFFRNGRGVCQAYTLVFNGLMKSLGIESSYASSDAMSHIWNVVRLNAKWYHVDVTWDDPTADQFGLAHHNNLLLSDTAIATARGSSTQKHHNWTCSYTCTDTTYDSYFWESSTSPFQYLDGEWYYTSYDSSKNTSALNSYNFNAKKSTPVYDMDKWYSSNGSGSYFTNCYSGLSSYNGTLYFNTCNKILSYTASAGVKTFHTPSISTAIYGMRTEDGKLYYNVSTSPSGAKSLNSVNLESEKLPYSAPVASAVPSQAPAASDFPITVIPDPGSSQTPAVSEAPAVSNPQKGDVNMDGSITLADAQLVLKFALKLASPSAQQTSLADVNNDSSVALNDAQLILKRSLKLISSF